MDVRILLVAIASETDVVLVRKRTRRLAELIGFDVQDQTRITTAVSEIARNAFEYARGGQVEFRLTDNAHAQHFVIVVRDNGPGIADLDAILEGTRRSPTGMGLGLPGARRLMDALTVETRPGAGTTVRLTRQLPAVVPPVTSEAIRRLTTRLAEDGPADALDEIRQQNQQILLQMQELRDRQDDLQRLNEELQDTNRGVVALYAELDERADHLRRADELKSKFLSHMSHEFRTPLNSILALSRLLLSRSDGALTPEQETQVEFIRRAAENLTELVNDLLDLARVEAGKTVITPSTFTAANLFGTLRGMLRPLLVGDAVALVFDEAADVPALDTDEGKVSQVLRNFISNAIKFTEHGEVRIGATADAEADTVTFHVRDTGLGIAAADLEIIFQEFGQVSNKLQARVKGTGLGLPLARKLTELLGGHIGVESKPGVGSTFSVTLPRVYRTPAEADDIEQRLQLEPGKIPVLLVEDDPADAFVVERVLADSAYQPLVCRSIREAEHALSRFRPVVILLDVLLGTEESWRLLLRLRESEAVSDVPMVVMSSAGDERKALNLGADEYLAKPIDGDVLLDLLNRLTGQQAVTKVLAVDDEEVTLYLVRQLLPRSRYSVLTARDGQEGLQQLAAARPDIILFDLNMPGMNGFEFLQRLRGTPAYADIPAVVLTSGGPRQIEQIPAHSVSGILSKGELSATTLADLIETVLLQTEAVGAR
ncbi:MAG TPA: ATP-binding protein [Acetobacteraceae bacterium]|jgi:signal transduction histidine kinase/CheY-like chemotaxis protein